MKVSLLQQILRSEWFFQPEALQSYLPLVAKLIQGESVKIEDQKPEALFYINESGRRVNPMNFEEVEGSENIIAVVSAIGGMIKYGDICTWGADEIVNQLKQADANDYVDGMIIYVDGPGGAVNAAAPFVEFAQNKSKPLVALCDTAASLHYWIANTADAIVADNDISSQFGSVGVVTAFADQRKRLESMGVKIHEIYAPESTHKNESYRLAMEGKYDKIKQEHLSPMAKRFQSFVRSNRPNLKEETGVLTGKMFYAEQALELGMIDAIGNMKTAVDQVLMLNEMNQVNP